jgi:hypothetical protein
MKTGEEERAELYFLRDGRVQNCLESVVEFDEEDAS